LSLAGQPHRALHSSLTQNFFGQTTFHSSTRSAGACGSGVRTCSHPSFINTTCSQYSTSGVDRTPWRAPRDHRPTPTVGPRMDHEHKFQTFVTVPTLGVMNILIIWIDSSQTRRFLTCFPSSRGTRSASRPHLQTVDPNTLSTGEENTTSH
jgi:hypothetical protein